VNPPTRDELIALKAQEEAKREAYLRRRFKPDELWRWQQASTEALARLRPELSQRLRLRSDFQ
jgi:hypothetical protein